MEGSADKRLREVVGLHCKCQLSASLPPRPTGQMPTFYLVLRWEDQALPVHFREIVWQGQEEEEEEEEGGRGSSGDTHAPHHTACFAPCRSFVCRHPPTHPPLTVTCSLPTPLLAANRLSRHPSPHSTPTHLTMQS